MTFRLALALAVASILALADIASAQCANGPCARPSPQAAHVAAFKVPAPPVYVPTYPLPTGDGSGLSGQGGWYTPRAVYAPAAPKWGRPGRRLFGRLARRS
jgi:hypothetical protein